MPGGGLVRTLLPGSVAAQSVEATTSDYSQPQSLMCIQGGVTVACSIEMCSTICAEDIGHPMDIPQAAECHRLANYVEPKTLITSCPRRKRKDVQPQVDQCSKLKRLKNMEATSGAEMPEGAASFSVDNQENSRQRCKVPEVSRPIDPSRLDQQKHFQNVAVLAVQAHCEASAALSHQLLHVNSSPSDAASVGLNQPTADAQRDERRLDDIPEDDYDFSEEAQALELAVHIQGHVSAQVPADCAPEEPEEDDDCQQFDPLLFIKSLPPLHLCVPQYREMLLPKQTRSCRKKTIVLDLDETLVHSSLELVAKYDFCFPVIFNNHEHTVHVRKRPYLQLFMDQVSKWFEVVVFTASQKIYAERLLNIVDPERAWVRHRVYRDSCVVWRGNYLKDLSVLGRDLRDTFIVDNSPQAFGFQIENGIPIDSWYDDEDDTALKDLLPFLERLVHVDDVRPVILSHYKLKQQIDQVRQMDRAQYYA